MNCEYFSLCGSCKIYDKSYKEQLAEKISFMKEFFKEFGIEKFEIFESKESRFRDRAEFRIIHQDGSISYAMHKLKEKGLLPVKECQIVNDKIYETMPVLKREIEKSPLLKEKLFTVEFLSCGAKDLLITLIYHKKIGKEWEEEAKKLSETLSSPIIGRSKKIKIVLEREFIEERLKIEGKEYRYRYFENSFTQPNSSVNEKMIGWAKKHSKNLNGDLLELYCGHGNFTIPLSENFQKVLATEISKTSIKSAKINCRLNGVENIEFVRLSSEELISALKKEREFRRLKEINIFDFDFTTVFVDPPRAGLDEKTAQFIKNFQNIIYISCNPKTLKRDLLNLKGFKIEKFALFDQFPYTNHIESGVLLKKE